MTAPLHLICGADDMPDVLAAVPDAAIISIRRWGSEPRAWTQGRAHTLCLGFDDVEEDKPAHGYYAPTRVDVEVAIDFARRRPDHRLVVHCAAGVSRSSGTLLAILADRLGPGAEDEACRRTMTAHNATVDAGLRPYGFGISPNRAIVEHADAILGRDGALIRAFVAAPWLTTKSHRAPGDRAAPGWVTDHEATAALRASLEGRMGATRTPEKPSTVRPDWKPTTRECRHGSSYLPHAEWTGDCWDLWLVSTCNERPDERCRDLDLDGNDAWPFVEPVASAADFLAIGIEAV